jgi:hypothetical protein
VIAAPPPMLLEYASPYTSVPRVGYAVKPANT